MATGGGVYIPLDAGFCDTQAARQTMRRFGPEGFVAYVRLLCALLREPSGCLRWGLDDDLADLADVLGMGEDETRELLAILQHYGAVVVEDGRLTAPAVLDGIAARSEVSQRMAELGRKSGEARRRKSGGDAR